MSECVQIRAPMPMGLIRAISGERFRNAEKEANTQDVPDEKIVGVTCVIAGPTSATKYVVWAVMQVVGNGHQADFQMKFVPGTETVITPVTDMTKQEVGLYLESHPDIVKRPLTKKRA